MSLEKLLMSGITENFSRQTVDAVGEEAKFVGGESELLLPLGMNR